MKLQYALYLTVTIPKLIVAAKAVIWDPSIAKGMIKQMSEGDWCCLSQFPQIPGIN